MQLQQFSQCYPLESTEAPRVLILKELLCLLRRKALNHTQSILRATLYVNHKSRSLHLSVGAACRGLRSQAAAFVLSRRSRSLVPTFSLTRIVARRIVILG